VVARSAGEIADKAKALHDRTFRHASVFCLIPAAAEAGCRKSLFETGGLLRLACMTTSNIQASSGEDSELEAGKKATGHLGICRTVLLGSLLIVSAGCYASLGAGGGPVLHGDLRTAALGEGDGANGRLAVGVGGSRLSVESSVSRFGLDSSTATAVGAHLRLRFPIHGGFSAFGRAGLERVWLGDLPSMSSTPDVHLYPNKVGGLGLEYRLSAPLLGKAGLWAEVSDDRLDMGTHTRGALLWTTGVLLGL
jgi:hypothetical protein